MTSKRRLTHSVLGAVMAVASATAIDASGAAAAHDPHDVHTAAWGSPAWYARKRPAPNWFWRKVAWCETHANWRHRSPSGNYGGGLGIAWTTWRAFGGYEFARHPSRATMQEQIRVANRISVRGYLKPDGTFQYPVRFMGWGCIRNKEYLKIPNGVGEVRDGN